MLLLDTDSLPARDRAEAFQALVSHNSSRLGTSLEQSIISQRLEGARRDLAAPTAPHRTVAEVAAAWGFANLSHFAKRFRQAYGMSPTEWRASTAPAPEPR